MPDVKTETSVRYDLGSARNELRKKPWGKKLSGLIDQYQDLFSSSIDLEQASAAIFNAISANWLLKAENSHPEPLAIGSQVRSHFMAALITYMRATETSSDVRRQMPIRRWLTPEQIADHDRIKLLRNECFGHFGYGVSSGYDRWYRETVLLTDKPGHAELSFVFQRHSIMPDDARRLVGLIDTVVPACREELERRGQAVMSAINDQLDDDLAELLERHIFNPAELYGGEDPENEIDRLKAAGGDREIGWFGRNAHTPEPSETEPPAHR